MTAQPSITAVGLSKRYRLANAPDGAIDAVRNVSFEIGEGEGVGLIGRNGAGKSTLLRILSRVTRPSAGYADVYGTVGALLEVGTGFHPELTGRENTYLSGAILGLSTRDVRARFDEIVEFADIAPFIDTPVKRYSSGMYARLGFAVAAHLRPSILIVDEVLAVGDLAFQAKCLAHMHRLTGDGTTVLFVSHNLLAVADLCPRVLFMDAGELVFDGATIDGIKHYRRSVATFSSGKGDTTQESPLTMLVNGRTEESVVEVQAGDSLVVDLIIDRPTTARLQDTIVNLTVDSHDGRTLMHLRSDIAGSRLSLHPGRNRLGVVVDELPISGGSYSLWARVVSLDSQDAFIWDSKRVLMTVGGGASTDGLIVPKHHFVQSTEVVSSR